jgi:hypothetical protein
MEINKNIIEGSGSILKFEKYLSGKSPFIWVVENVPFTLRVESTV